MYLLDWREGAEMTTLQRTHLVYLRRQRVHPVTVRDTGIGVQYHFESGRGEDTLLQQLEGEKTY